MKGPLEEECADDGDFRRDMDTLGNAVLGIEVIKLHDLRFRVLAKIKEIFCEGRVGTGRHLLRILGGKLRFPGDTLSQLSSIEERSVFQKDFHLVREMCIAFEETCIFFEKGYPAEGLWAWSICRGYAEKLKLKLPLDPPSSSFKIARVASLNNETVIGFDDEENPIRVPGDLRTAILCAHRAHDRDDLLQLRKVYRYEAKFPKLDPRKKQYYLECLELLERCLEEGGGKV